MWMRSVTESATQPGRPPQAAVREEIATAERVAKAIQDKLDRLDETFFFERSIDIETYDRHAENCARSSRSPGRPSLKPARRTRRGNEGFARQP
jgi:hypothetical protein